MTLRRFVACLIASSTCSFTLANASTPTGNPKTTQKPYAMPATQSTRATRAAVNVVPIATSAGAQKSAGSAKNQQPGTALGSTNSAAGILGTTAPPPNDFCATPTVISLVLGTNSFPFDNTFATTGAEGQSAGSFGCPSPGYENYRDVWFEFTAPQGGICNISTCGQTTVDTKLVVWDGPGCPTNSPIACNDDGGGLCTPQSEILGVPVGSGTSYLIQLGSAVLFRSSSLSPGGGQLTSVGNLVIEFLDPPPTSTCCEPGVGGVMACPCTNPPGALGRGCNNKDATGGASLSASGTPSLSAPLATTLVFMDTGQNNIGSQVSILMQGKVLTSGIPFGHGVRCFGAFLRLYSHSGAPWIAPAGTFTAPIAPDLTIPDRSAAAGQPIPVGAQRYYQVYYRDNVNFLPAVTCSTAASKQNISNGQWCTWGP